MKNPAKMAARFKLPARLRNKPTTARHFEARIALADRIADLPGVATIERNGDTVPCRIDIYLRRGGRDRGLKRQPARLLCSLDRDSIAVNGLDQWDRYQVLSRGWGRLVDNLVSVHLPRDRKELETVWSIIKTAYDRNFESSAPEPDSVTVSTWDWPKFSRTSLQ
jgi:hypothetical protein